jgi:hypothetical protein
MLQSFKLCWWPAVACGVTLLILHVLPLPQKGAIFGIPTLCPFRAVLGLPCPGCGMTRALVYCAHGDWSAALAFHPLAPLVFGALWITCVAGVLHPLTSYRRGASGVRVLPSLAQRATLPIGVLFALALLGVWVWRLSHLAALPPSF